MDNNLASIKLIIGLGNPGQQYAKQRHNIGFRAVDEIAHKLNLTWQSKENFEYTKIEKDTRKIYLCKPLTFMNSSGKVLPHFTKKGILPQEILVIHDELEKPFGTIKLRFGGSAKGHNGLRSVIEAIGQDFWRMQFGIGRPENREDVPTYVLSNFSASEEKLIESLIYEIFPILGI